MRDPASTAIMCWRPINCPAVPFQLSMIRPTNRTFPHYLIITCIPYRLHIDPHSPQPLSHHTLAFREGPRRLSDSNRVCLLLPEVGLQVFGQVAYCPPRLPKPSRYLFPQNAACLVCDTLDLIIVVSTGPFRCIFTCHVSYPNRMETNMGISPDSLAAARGRQVARIARISRHEGFLL